MTREEAIGFGKMWLDINSDAKDSLTYEFFEQALEALKSQPCGDAVSKSNFDSRVRAAVGMVEEELTEDFKDGIKMVLELLKTEPPVTPAIPTCGDAVSREFMYKLGAKCIATRNENGVLVAIASIESLPPVTPKPKTGHWIDDCPIMTDEGRVRVIRCSYCNEWRKDYYGVGVSKNYCPKCGAKMEGEERCN